MNQPVVLRTARSVCPHDCPSACALDVDIIDGNTIGRVRGAKDDPYTAGVICEKVARYAERMHHPERLMHPLRRSGPKGSGQFERISWDEALNAVADKMIELRKDGNVRMMAPAFTGSQTQSGGTGMPSKNEALDGVLTLTTNAEVVMHNNEDGVKAAGAAKTLTWRVTPLTKDAPTAVLPVAWSTPSVLSTGTTFTVHGSGAVMSVLDRQLSSAVWSAAVAGMSVSEREKTAELLGRISQGRSVVVIEHDMEFVKSIAHKVTVLHQGKILAEGSMESVQSNPKVIEVYLGH